MTTVQTLPLLITKFYIPPIRSVAISRPHLIAQFDHATNRKLTLLIAPAGFGKSTLAADWAQETAKSVAWLSLDQHDNDLNRFWSYCINALSQLFPGLGDAAMGLLRNPQPTPIESILTVLINELTSLDEPITLILDDFHVIDTEPIMTSLTFLLNYAPPSLHLILITRHEPSLPLAQFRARAELTEIDATTLRFSLDETSTLLNQMLDIPLETHLIEALHDHTEGWVTGLILAALSIQNTTDQDTVINQIRGSQRYIGDYFTDAVFDNLPSTTQDFLLKTSVLDQMCAALCDTITELENSQSIREYLERSHLFIVPLDNNRHWYRYHHLFREYLQSHLNRTDINRQILYSRAAVWYGQNGMLEEAIHYAFLAEEFSVAVQLILQAFNPMWIQGELATIRRWIEDLPTNIVQYNPRLMLYFAWSHFLSGNLDQMATILLEIPAKLDPTMDDYDDLRGILAVQQASIPSLYGQVDEAINYSQTALHYLPEENLIWRGAALMGLGFAYRSGGDMVAAEETLAGSIQYFKDVGNRYAALFALSQLASLQESMGLLYEAARTYRQAIHLSETDGKPLPISSWAYVGLGRVNYEWNNIEQARHYIEQGYNIGQFQPDTIVISSIARTQLAALDDDTQQVHDLIQSAYQIIQQMSFDPSSGRLGFTEVELALRNEDLPTALRWLQSADISPTDNVQLSSFGKYLSLARILVAQSDYPTAISLLNQLLQLVELSGRLGDAIKVLVLLGIAHFKSDQTDMSFTTIAQAIEIAHIHNYRRVFIDEGSAMADLLTAMQQTEHASNAVNHLLESFHETGSTQEQSLIEPLTERELEILDLVAAGRSNRDIAETLILTVGTVKWYLNRIYGKLSVSSRTQALVRARELDLLP